MVARVIPIRPPVLVVPDPPHGTLSETQPSRGLALESGCDWGHCGRRGVVWRFDAVGAMGAQWLVVCRTCAEKPV